MSIYKNGKKLDEIYVGGKKVSKIFRGGGVIYSSFIIPEIKPFSEATEDEIAQYLDLHYKGTIDISNYWKVGDTRTMHINAIAANTNAPEGQVAQDIKIVILDFNHDKLENTIGIRNNAAISLQCKELLGDGVEMQGGPIWSSRSSVPSGSNWSDCPRNKWLNNKFFKALPENISSLIKSVSMPYLTSQTSDDIKFLTCQVFFPSLSEIWGVIEYDKYPAEGSEIEGAQYEYYKKEENRIKYGNGDSAKEECPYWTRSMVNNSKQWGLIDGLGDYGVGIISRHYGICPAFCL